MEEKTLNQESGLSISEAKKIYERVAEWYSQMHLHYLIARKSYRREFCIMSQNGMMRRSLRVHNAQNFQYTFRLWHVLDRFRNGRGLEKFYHSALIFKDGIPYQNPDLSTSITTHIFWREKYTDYIEGYDFFIDIDADSHKDFDLAKESMLSIHEHFKELNVPHEINFSGCGFHIIIPYYFLPNRSFIVENKDNIYAYCLKHAKYLYKNFSELIDMSIYEPRRIMKCPYTLALYGKDLYVCTPIVREDDLYTCKLDSFTPENVKLDDDFKIFYDKSKKVGLL